MNDGSLLVATAESGPGVEHQLTATQARQLRESRIVSVEPIDERTWLVSGTGKVGVARVADMTLRVEPKLPIGRIFFLLGYGRKFAWHDDDVEYGTADDLVVVLAEAFVRQAKKALGRGVLQGYVEVDDELAVVRGRLRSQEQVTRRFGQVTPLLVRYDDFTIDVAENQLIKAAARVLRTVPGLPRATRRELRSLTIALDGVSDLVPGQPLPTWIGSRRNAHYDSVLWFATTILRHRAIDMIEGEVSVNGFIVNMATVFEEFLEVALGDALERIDGRVRPQDLTWMDVDSTVEMRPDLVWYRGGRAAAVIDAKYKAEKPAGYPNADRYQMLAYCTALGLSTGHLVYAKGNEPESNIEVIGSGTNIQTHALDLAALPSELMKQIETVASSIRETTISNGSTDADHIHRRHVSASHRDE